ncbi:MAG: RNA 2',3'-cyclic phosphodiesterase [Desulfurococcaceae archaeon]
MMLNEMRVFVAIDIGSIEVLEKLSRFRDFIVSTGADLKPVDNENLHVTIRFIGEVPVRIVTEICNNLLKIVFKPFKIHVRGVGAFPSVTKPRVIWAGVSEGADELIKIHDEVENMVRKLGIPPDRERFIPHITLARVRSDRGLSELAKIIAENYNYDFGEFVVKEIVLKKSILTPSGPIYSNICSVKAIE